MYLLFNFPEQPHMTFKFHPLVHLPFMGYYHNSGLVLYSVPLKYRVQATISIVLHSLSLYPHLICFQTQKDVRHVSLVVSPLRTLMRDQVFV